RSERTESNGRGDRSEGEAQAKGARSIWRSLTSRAKPAAQQAKCRELLHRSRVGVSQPVGHAREELAGEAGHLVDETRKFALAEYDELHVGLGDNRGVAGGFFEQRELAERVARAAGRELAAVAVH